MARKPVPPRPKTRQGSGGSAPAPAREDDWLFGPEPVGPILHPDPPMPRALPAQAPQPAPQSPIEPEEAPPVPAVAPVPQDASQELASQLEASRSDLRMVTTAALSGWEVPELAKKAAVATAIKIMADPIQNPRLRLRAITTLNAMDRAERKGRHEATAAANPKPSVNVNVMAAPMPVVRVSEDLKRLTDEELAEELARLEAGGQ